MVLYGIRNEWWKMESGPRAYGGVTTKVPSNNSLFSRLNFAHLCSRLAYEREKSIVRPQVRESTIPKGLIVAFIATNLY